MFSQIIQLWLLILQIRDVSWLTCMYTGMGVTQEKITGKSYFLEKILYNRWKKQQKNGPGEG